MKRWTALFLALGLSVAGCGDDDPASSPPAPRRGAIVISPRAVSATFEEVTVEEWIEDSVRSDGACVVRRAHSNPETPESRYVSAGGLTVSGIEQCTASAPGYACDAQLWEPEESRTVTITATGDEVPAFTHEIATPVLPEITVPTAVLTSTDYVLRWEGGTGRVRAQMASTARVEGTDEYVALTVTCEADAARGELTVPRAVLVEIAEHAPSASSLRSLVIMSVVEDDFAAGDYELTATVYEVLGNTLVSL